MLNSCERELATLRFLLTCHCDGAAEVCRLRLTVLVLAVLVLVFALTFALDGAIACSVPEPTTPQAIPLEGARLVVEAS